MGGGEPLDIEVTPKGFRTLVGLVLSGEAGEYITESPPAGSLLARAVDVAERCQELAAELDAEIISADIYEQAVEEVAPEWASN